MLVFIAPQMGLNSSYMQKPNFKKKMSQRYCQLKETHIINQIFFDIFEQNNLLEMKQYSSSDG